MALKDQGSVFFYSVSGSLSPSIYKKRDLGNRGPLKLKKERSLLSILQPPSSPRQLSAQSGHSAGLQQCWFLFVASGAERSSPVLISLGFEIRRFDFLHLATFGCELHFPDPLLCKGNSET